MLVALGWKFWTAHRQRAQLRHAFSYFVPREVVNALERNAGVKTVADWIVLQL